MSVPAWAWIATLTALLAVLAVDLLAHRHARKVTVCEALAWSAVWLVLGTAFGAVVWAAWGGQRAGEYFGGYLIEKSLAVDNIFVFALIFAGFAVPQAYQHRVLFYGVLGALVMRAGFIAGGVALLDRFGWVVYIFGAFLLVTAGRMVHARDREPDPRTSRSIRLVRRVLPAAEEYHGQRFWIRRAGRPAATPLLVVLVLIEISDVIFAADSIPAVLAITGEPFLVFTSNAFAILGLRWLYFLLAGLMDRFAYLKLGLAAVLGFVGLKMLLADLIEIPIATSLGIIAGCLAVAVAASVPARLPLPFAGTHVLRRAFRACDCAASEVRSQADDIPVRPAMTAGPVFTSRLSGRQLLDSDGLAIGRVRDVVILPTAGGDPPWVLGLVVTLQRRHIFVNLGRVAEISIDGAHLRGGTVDLRRFSRRTGEILASELYGQPAGDGRVVDVGIVPSQRPGGGWEVSSLAISQGRSLALRHSSTIVPWDKHPELFKTGPMAEQLILLREMNPTDLANAVETMSAARRRQLAEALQDEELADVLEEMPEQDQVRLLASLGLERSADVVEEMEPDDAADLLAEMPAEQRERLLSAMETVQADDLRRLLRYDATTAGGLMTSHPLIVPPDTPIAEVLAQIREPDMAMTTAAQVYVCEPPSVTPTGRYLGTVGFQQLLRHPPAASVGECIEESNFIRPGLPEKEVARRMAAYNLIGVAVCDEAGRLVGAITVDDVMDRILPTGWRKSETA